MEIFEVFYRGNKLEAKKTSEGKIYVDLPIRYGKREGRIFERISRDTNGWEFSSTKLNDFENTFRLWIRDDGRIAAYNNNTDKIIVMRDVFNPEAPNLGKLNKLVIELYKTVEQLKAYEEKDIPADAIKKLRMANLMSTLKLLGYSSIKDIEAELDESKVYFSLGKIRQQLVEYVNLGAYVNVEERKKDEDLIRVNIPEGMTREQFLRNAEPIKDECISNISFMKEEEEKREQKRSIKSDYRLRARKKMPESDWLLYSRIIKETARLLLELNVDLIYEKDGLEIPNLSKLTGSDLKDRINRLINSKDFARACDIENRFIVREATRLIEELESMLSEIDKETRRTPITEALEQLRKEETEIINERGDRNERKGDTSSNLFASK